MAHPQVAAFARLADGNAKATRSIAGQHTQITRTIHEVEYNPVRDEIVIPQIYLQGILTFRGSANGDEPPLRVIAGPKTQLKNPDRLALDPIHDEIYVPLGDRLLVFPALGNGDIAPIRVIEGPDTQLWGTALAADPVNNLLIIGGRGPRYPGEKENVAGWRVAPRPQIIMFNRTDSGNVKPRAIIQGPRTQLADISRVKVHPPTKYILAGVNRGQLPSPASFVGVWSENDSGDVPPRWTIGGPNQILRQVRGVALVPKAKNVVITDKYLNGIMTFEFPEIF